MIFLLVDIYCDITTALWSRDDSAVVSVYPPTASMDICGQVCGSCNRHRWEVWRTGQAGVFRKKLNLRSKMSDGWSCRVVSGSSIGGSGSAVSCWVAGDGHKEAVSVAGGCLYTMSVDLCTLYAGVCLRSISSVSPWYPLVPPGPYGPALCNG